MGELAGGVETLGEKRVVARPGGDVGHAPAINEDFGFPGEAGNRTTLGDRIGGEGDGRRAADLPGRRGETGRVKSRPACTCVDIPHADIMMPA
jgi:hypothetical protein